MHSSVALDIELRGGRCLSYVGREGDVDVERCAPVNELYKDIYKLVANLPSLAKVLGAEFAKNWNSAGAFGKGQLVGEIVGYIVLTIAIGVLSEG